MKLGRENDIEEFLEKLVSVYENSLSVKFEKDAISLLRSITLSKL